MKRFKENFKREDILHPAILFGGNNSERLVSLATVKHLTAIFPDADLWYWSPDDTFHAVDRQEVLMHEKPFQVPFIPSTKCFANHIDRVLDRAVYENRVLLLALHGGTAENGILAAKCEKRNLPFTGSGSRASKLAFNKASAKEVADRAGVLVSPSLTVSYSKPIVVEELLSWLSRYSKLVAKPVSDGSSYGLLFIETELDLERLAVAVEKQEYIVEPFLSGIETTVAVIDYNGCNVALPPVEIRLPPTKVFDYTGKYLGNGVEEICPATFPETAITDLKKAALRVHEAIGAFGYSRSDFILTSNGPTFLEINTLPGLTEASLLPLALQASGISMFDFLASQIKLAEDRYT